ncbi:MAG: hypothetical protein EXR86_01390 [Gammaproteobacteria bacterium]|nr:hypothetical protein [Gammaproteobacteria bacterium]
MPNADRDNRLSGYGRVPGLASLVLIAGCWQTDPPILGPESSARVTAIELEAPPAKTTATPAPAADTLDLSKKIEPMRPPVELPAAKVEPAEGRLEVTLADVRQAALHHNLDIQVEQIRPALSREDTAEAEARFEPTGFARYTHSKLDVPGIPHARAADRTAIDDAEFGISLPLQTGGSATVSMPVTRTDFGIPGAANSVDTAASFSLSQPLLRDAGFSVNRAPITIARLRERQQDSRTKLAILNVLANTERTYWGLYAAARSVEVRLKQHERARTQEHQAIRLTEEGVLPRIEITRARAGVARRIEDIIRAENLRRQTERELKRVMNRPELPVSSATALIATSPPDPRELEIEASKALQTAYSNRMELLDLELQMASDALSVDVERNAKLPNLAFDYSFKYLGAASRFSRSIDQIGETDFTDQFMGVTLEVPLGNAAREARFRRALVQSALTQTTTHQQRQFIERQVLDAIDQIQEAWQRILAAREETLLAATNYKAEQSQFLAGARTSTDVLEATDFLAEAQLREINALATYEIAKIDLAFVTGTLLGSGKVELQPYTIPATAARLPVAPSVAQTSQRVEHKLDALGVDASTPTQIVREADPVPAPAPPPTTTPPEIDAAVSFGPVAATDTVWAIAQAHRPRPDVAVPVMIDAIVRANPTAFEAQDPTRLRLGVTLRIPEMNEVAATTSAAVAARGTSP